MLVQDVLASAGFKGNPFRIVPPTDMDNILWAGDKTRIEELLEAAQSPRADNLGTSEFVILFGEYGSGKTNALKWLVKNLSREGELVAYLIKPSVADKPAWHDIVRTLFTRNFQKDDVLNRLRPLRQWALRTSKGLAENEMGGNADVDQLREATTRYGVEVNHLVSPESPGFVHFALDMCEPGNTEIAKRNWSYLSDELPRAQASAIASNYGLPPEGMSSDYSATLLLSNLVRVITFQPADESTFRPGAGVVCLLIDEIDGLIDFTPTSRLSIHQGIRDLFNACTEHLFIALAATGSDASEMWGILDPPLMQRLSRQPIEFLPMTVEAARAFLIEVMGINRKTDYEGTPEWPFTEDGLEAFVDACPQPLTPRKLLLSAQRILFQNCKEKVIAGEGVDGGDVISFTQWAT